MSSKCYRNRTFIVLSDFESGTKRFYHQLYSTFSADVTYMLPTLILCFAGDASYKKDICVLNIQMIDGKYSTAAAAVAAAATAAV